MRLYILSSPRAGSKYTQEVARVHGVTLAHEVETGVDSDGLVGFPHDLIRESGDYQSAIELATSKGRLIHLVRHPLRVISSLQTCTKMIAEDNLPEAYGFDTQESDPFLVRIMKFWLGWNEALYVAAQAHLRVEDVPCDAFIEEIGAGFRSLPLPPTNTNTRAGQFKPLEWEELRAADDALAWKIARMTARLGYLP